MVDTPELRILVLLRHAQAKGSSADGDLGRELTSSGRETAAHVGEWLREQGVRPDVAVLSPSTRTRQTWEGLRAGGLDADDVWTDSAIYDADPADIVESINAVPDDVSTLVVVGHAIGLIERDGRWTVDAWAPTDGFVVNGGIRMKFGG